MTDRVPLTDALARLRDAAGLTQRELADRVNVTHGTIGRWERGTAVPHQAHLRAVARELGVPSRLLTDRSVSEKAIDDACSRLEEGPEPNVRGDDRALAAQVAQLAARLERVESKLADSAQ